MADGVENGSGRGQSVVSGHCGVAQDSATFEACSSRSTCTLRSGVNRCFKMLRGDNYPRACRGSDALQSALLDLFSIFRQTFLGAGNENAAGSVPDIGWSETTACLDSRMCLLFPKPPSIRGLGQARRPSKGVE